MLPQKKTVARELASEAGNGALQGGERASAAFIANAVAALPDAPVVAPPLPPAVDAAEQRVASAAAAERRRLGVCKPCAPAVSAPAPSVPAAMELDTPPASAMEVETAPAPAPAPSVPEPPAPDPGLAPPPRWASKVPRPRRRSRRRPATSPLRSSGSSNPGAAVSAPETGSRQSVSSVPRATCTRSARPHKKLPRR